MEEEEITYTEAGYLTATDYDGTEFGQAVSRCSRCCALIFWTDENAHTKYHGGQMNVEPLTPAEENSLKWIAFKEWAEEWLDEANHSYYTKGNVIAKVRGKLAMLEGN